MTTVNSNEHHSAPTPDYSEAKKMLIHEIEMGLRPDLEEISRETADELRKNYPGVTILYGDGEWR